MAGSFGLILGLGVVSDMSRLISTRLPQHLLTSFLWLTAATIVPTTEMTRAVMPRIPLVSIYMRHKKCLFFCSGLLGTPTPH